jgi:DNA replication protein DnaC
MNAQFIAPSFKTRQINCPTHGQQTERGIMARWFGCPVCSDEAAKRESAAADAQAKRDFFAAMNLPELFADAGFAGYHIADDRQRTIVDRIKSYAAELKKPKGGKNLILSGATGTGKTHLASAVLRNLANTNVRCRYITSAQFVAEIRACWSNRSAFEADVIARYGSVPVLLIDELGVSDAVKNTSGYQTDHWSALIDMRYRNRLPTIITTNLDDAALALLIGDRAADRLLPASIWAECSWPSYRRAVSKMERL